MATVYPEARNLCAVVTYTRSPIRVRETAAWSGRAVAWLWELVASVPPCPIFYLCERFGEVYSLPPFPPRPQLPEPVPDGGRAGRWSGGNRNGGPGLRLRR